MEIQRKAHYLKNKNKLSLVGKQFVIFVKLNAVMQGKILSFVPLINLTSVLVTRLSITQNSFSHGLNN